MATDFVAALVGGGAPTLAASMTSADLTRQAFVATGAAVSLAVQLVELPIFAAICRMFFGLSSIMALLGAEENWRLSWRHYFPDTA